MSRAGASLWASAAFHAVLPMSVSFDVDDVVVARKQPLLPIELDAVRLLPPSESTASATQPSAPVSALPQPRRGARNLRPGPLTAPAVEQATPPAAAPVAEPLPQPDPDFPSANASLSAGSGDRADSEPRAPASAPIARAAPSVASRVRGRAGADAIRIQSLRAAYLSSLRERIAAKRRYPYQARRAGIEGSVCLQLRLDARGRLAELRSTCAAPSAALLEAALEAVRAAAPFGPLPEPLGRELTADLPVVFRLQSDDPSEEQ